MLRYATHQHKIASVLIDLSIDWTWFGSVARFEHNNPRGMRYMTTQDQNAQNVAQETTKSPTRKTTAKATDKKQSALSVIQSTLKAPKNIHNSYGGFWYRNAESILEAVKPLLAENNCTLVLRDDVRCVGQYTFIEATAIFTDENGKETVVTACAGVEPKKGMDLSQAFGASSSYARKYALNGLFLIDDTKDADSDEYQNQVRKNNNQQQNNAQNNQQQRSQNNSNLNNQQPNNAQYNQQPNNVTPPAVKQKPKHLFDLDPSQHQAKFNDALGRIKTAIDANALNAAVDFFAGTIYANDINNTCSARADQLGILNNG